VADGLTKRYGGIAVVDGVSFEVGRGEIFGILGGTARGRRPPSNGASPQPDERCRGWLRLVKELRPAAKRCMMCPFMDRVQRLVALGGRVVRPEPVMTLPRSAADVLADHVLFEIEAIDRMYLNLYQPRLQHGAGIAAFFVGHRGHRFASSALMAPMTRAFVADIGHFAAARGLDLVRFAPGAAQGPGHRRVPAPRAGR